MKNKNKKREIFSCNFFPKNCKGFLLGEETLKIILAVISIGFLIFLLTALYYSLTGSEKIKQADASLNNLVLNEINLVDSGQYTEKQVHVPNPLDWIILSFIGEDKKPNSCLGENCLCICEEAIDLFDWQIKRCDEKGACTLIPNLKKFDKIKIEQNGIDILIKKAGEEIEIE